MNESISIIRARCSDTKDEAWLYVAAGGKLVTDEARAERLSTNEAGRRLLQYLNDYPGWEFEEIDAAGNTEPTKGTPCN